MKLTSNRILLCAVVALTVASCGTTKPDELENVGEARLALTAGSGSVGGSTSKAGKSLWVCL